jgi:hypothetical protein
VKYKPKSVAALHIALGSLPDKMRVQVDPDIRVSAKTVGELRKVTAWPDNLVIATAFESRGFVYKINVCARGSIKDAGYWPRSCRALSKSDSPTIMPRYNSGLLRGAA